MKRDPALVLQHGDWGPPGLLADWAAARGIPLEIHRADLGEPLPELNGQAFAHGPHLGVQFHPESTIEIVRSWAWTDRGRISALGIDDGEALLERGRHHAEPAAQAAFDLFDAFWKRT